MKTLIFFAILFCMIVSPARAALTDADLNKIRLIVKEEVKTEINASEKRMKTYIDTKIDAVNTRIDGVEKSLGARIDGVEKSLGTRIDAVEARLGARIDSVEERITLLTNVFYGLIALIVAAIAIPQSILAWQNRGNRSLEKRIEALTQEVEALKRQQILRP